MSFTFQLRRDVAADWTSKNPKLNPGEPGIETDTNKLKLGNGIDFWNDLAYFPNPSDLVSGVASVDGRDGVVVLSDLYATLAALAAKAPLASPTFTGMVTAADATVTGRLRQNYDALSDAGTIAIDASLGNRFEVTVTGNHILGNPSNLVHGQPLLILMRQDGTGTHVVTLGNKYRDPNGYYTGLATAAGARSYLGVVYDSTDDQIDVLAFATGY